MTRLRACGLALGLLPLFLILAAAAQTNQAAPTVANVVLRGEVKSSQKHTYVEVPFQVPAGVERLTLTFHYTERDQHTALDLGLEDPVHLRCWSGGNKSVLTVSIADATPSCLPGLIPAGTWKVLIGVPNIRPGVTSHFTAEVYFTNSGLVADEPAFLRAPLRTGPAWYRGDLHMHTAHSDGQCPNQTGQKVPCPVFLTVEAAVKRGLDFIAITDHNATSQYDVMRELQPYFDKVLLIPGREITTFRGHLNFLGTTSYVDFRLGGKSVPDMNTLLRSADKLGALVSINHPDAPSGEICMGCGWTPAHPVDMHLLAAVEAVNGGSEMHGFNGVPFWDKQLNAGYRLTGIGGSDNHNATSPLDEPSSVGSPTTVVYATELSTPAILAGIRAGHVFIDLTASHDRMLTMQASGNGQTAHMGDLLDAPKGTTVSFDVHETGANQGSVVLIEDGHGMGTLAQAGASDGGETFHRTWTADGYRHWFRPQVVGPDGKLWLLGNPVYVDWNRPSAPAE
ncbi:MAG TPA: CehA/McbA family metallohydrolase [Acidobacteriaceae bacterium]|nr:CehA/McbA family metallohydrolase [Acidobacteriaceae bacterium]